MSVLPPWQQRCQRGNTVGRPGNTVGRRGNTVGRHGNTVGRRGNTVGRRGNTVGRHGNTVGRHGTVVGRRGNAAAAVAAALRTVSTGSGDRCSRVASRPENLPSMTPRGPDTPGPATD